MGVELLTVHAAGGRKMLEAAVAGAGATKVLAVTVLTSLDAGDLAADGIGGSVEEAVTRRARLAEAAGCAGVHRLAAGSRRDPRGRQAGLRRHHARRAPGGDAATIRSASPRRARRARRAPTPSSSGAPSATPRIAAPPPPSSRASSPSES